MSELDMKIKDYEDQGWKMKERVGDHEAVMVKKTWGSKLMHVALFMFTLGIGNLIYGFWSRIMNSEKTTLRA